MTRSKRVLISILNYNSPLEAIDTVLSFRSQSYHPLHIQLVDNASSDNSVEILRKTFPKLDIVQLRENTGYTGGNNAGLERGVEDGYDYVLISNADIEVDENFVGYLVETAISHPDAGLIGALELDYYSKSITAAGGRGFNAFTSRGHWMKSFPKRENHVCEIDYAQGAAVLFTSKALRAGVRMDEKLFGYLDEIDIGFQLKELGLKAYCDARARAYHKCNPGRFNPFSGYLIQRNRLYIARKHSPRWVYACNLLLTGLVELPAKMLFRSIQGKRAFARAILAGFIDGIGNKMYVGRGSRLKNDIR